MNTVEQNAANLRKAAKAIKMSNADLVEACQHIIDETKVNPTADDEAEEKRQNDNKAWIAGIKSVADSIPDRVPTNKHNVAERLFGNKPKPPSE